LNFWGHPVAEQSVLRGGHCAGRCGVAGTAGLATFVIIIIIIIVVVIVIIMAPPGPVTPMVIVIIVIITAGKDQGHRLRTFCRQHSDSPVMPPFGLVDRTPCGDTDGRGQGSGRDKNRQGLIHGRVSFRLLGTMWTADLSAS
jgi:hypothetical protein